MNRRRFLLGSVIVLPLAARAEPPYGVVREIWFTVGQDAFFLRANSRLRLETASAQVGPPRQTLNQGQTTFYFNAGTAPRWIPPSPATAAVLGVHALLDAPASEP